MTTTSAPNLRPIAVRPAGSANNKVATASNFPAGRHSRYRAVTTTQNGWQRLKMLHDDRLDSATADSALNQVVMMLNPNTLTADTWYLDNDDVGALKGQGCRSAAQRVAPNGKGARKRRKFPAHARDTSTL